MNQFMILGAVALIGFGVGIDRCAPIIGAHGQIERVKADRDAWKQAQVDTSKVAVSWAARAGQEQALRGKEQRQAVSAQAATETLCSARVAKARASAFEIQSIITKEPARDQNGCPRRELVDPDRLRHALRPRP